MSDSAILGRSPWYRSLNRTQWKALIASNLGWTFDGFEVFALSHAKYWNGIAICTLKTLGATIIVSSLSPWRFCGGLLSRPPVGFARCGAQRGALRRLW